LISPFPLITTEIHVTDTSSCCFQVRDLDFAIQIVGSEIVREADGLAMSSRNVNLSDEDREKVCLLLQVAFCFCNEPFLSPKNREARFKYFVGKKTYCPVSSVFNLIRL
jgi:hypothetical protein